MSDDAYQALRDAVNLARHHGIRSKEALHAELIALGWSEATVNEAIQTWANYEKAKRS